MNRSSEKPTVTGSTGTGLLLLPLLLPLLLLSLFGCSLGLPGSGGGGGDLNEEESLLNSLGVYFILNPPATACALQNGTTLVNRANCGLEAWNIDLAQNIFGSSRNTSKNFQYNPQNWLTVSDNTCVATGIPPVADLEGGTCPLVGGVIGVCYTRVYTSGSLAGQIVDTTLMLLDTFQNGADTEAEKQSVFTHEIGHCLGLQHSGSTADIMFSDTSGANTPSVDELLSIQSAYDPYLRSPSYQASRYNTTSGAVNRHFSFPTFYISSSINGNAFRNENAPLPPPGPPLLSDQIGVVMHMYKADGSAIVRIRDKHGSHTHSLPPGTPGH